MLKIICLSLILFSTLLSCSEYSKVVKNDNYKRKYELGVRLYDKNDYVKSVALLEQVYQRMPKSVEGEDSYYRLGKAHFIIGDYYTAQYYLASFGDKYPQSPRREETSFLYALCAVKNSPKASLDQTETETALNELQLFIYKFPLSNKIDTCNFLMDQLRLKLQYKEIEAIKIYDKTENYTAAIVTAETFLKDYPTSNQREKIWIILIQNSYYLAKHSIEEKKRERIDKSLERYSKFVLEFPNSVHAEQLKEKLETLF